MKIIGAALGRTGTVSLARALEELGFGPCYHMLTIIKDLKQAQLWLDAQDGKVADWKYALAGYQSGVDYPFANFALEIFEAHPDAKVILSVRDFDKWYESTVETVYKNAIIPPWVKWIMPRFRVFNQMVQTVIWGGFFEGRFEERAFAIEKFEAYIELIKVTVPADQLLIYSVKEGWEPLCKFLDVPIPTKPFPYVNQRSMFKAGIVMGRVISFGLAIGIIALFGWIIF